MKRRAAMAFLVLLAPAPLLADSKPADRLRQETLFREHIERYLQAEVCARLYGGHEVTKKGLLTAAKEIARNLPEAEAEAIWQHARTENFTLPPLPPSEPACADLRTGVTR